MLKKSGIISTAIICSSAILAKYLIILPEYMVKYNANAAWIETIIKCIAAFAAFFIAIHLYKPFENVALDDVFKIAAGNFGGSVICFLYVICFTLFNAGLLRLLTEALSTVMAEDAPKEYFALFILSAIFMGAYLGLRATTNLSIVIFPFVVLSLFIVLLVLVPNYRTDNIMPIFGNGTQKLIRAVFTKHFCAFETVILFFFSNMSGNWRNMKKSGYLALTISFSFIILFTLAYCLTIPYPASKDFFLPLYQMTRMIKAGSFLQRLEPLVVFIWTSLILCSISALLCVSAKLFSPSAPQNHNGFVPVLLLITFFIAMLPKSETSAFNLYEKLLFVGPFLFPAVPVIFTVIARIRKKGGSAV